MSIFGSQSFSVSFSVYLISLNLRFLDNGECVIKDNPFADRFDDATCFL